MRKAMRNGWKRVCSVILAAAMVITMFPTGAQAAATSSSANADGTFSNPMIYADVPDIDMIRVGNAYYMVSTTMHLSPGCPVMKSTDLVNWEIVNYVYDILGDADEMNLRNGKSMYGNGQWASSLKYQGGKYYVAFNSNTTGRAYIYTTDDIERGSWEKTELNGFFHDMSLFFDDNGKGYILYGGGAIKCAELTDDYKSVKTNTEKTLFDVRTDTGETHLNDGDGLLCEGTHIMKKDGYYYVFNISWPNGVKPARPRLEMCHRSKTFPEGDWEGKVILESNFSNNGVNAGVAQGAIIDTPDNKWYGFLFQDHGAIGRTPVLTDCVWKDGWPMLGKDGDGKTVEAVMKLPSAGSDIKSLVKSDEFYNDAEHREFEAQTATEEAQKFLAAGEGAGNANPRAVTGDDGTDTDTSVIQLITNGGVETGTTDGWEITPGEKSGKLEVVNTDKASGEYSLYVSERGAMGVGACQNLSGKMKVGKKYTISGKLKYTTGPATKKFYVTIQHGPRFEYRQNMITINAEKGKWVEFSGDWTAADKGEFAFDPDQVHVFVETPWAASIDEENDLMDYYLDDFSMTTPNENMAGDSSFNSGAGPWAAFENQGTLEVVSGGRGGADDKCLKMSGRTMNWHGAGLVFGDKMTPGNTYTIKAWVKYDAATPATQKFSFTMKGLKGNETDPNKANYSSMAEGTAKSGEWTEFTGKWTMPEDANTAPDVYPWTLYVNTDEAGPSFMDYYLDDVTITEDVVENKDTPEGGEHDYNGSDLDLVWQWNHNPNNNNWSLTERSGWLRLKTGSKATSILNARNTLTQRTFGPTCSGSIKMDISKMEVGDVAGLASLSFKYGYIAVKKEASKTRLVMMDGSANDTNEKVDNPVEKASVDCTGTTVYLKEDFNYAGNADGSDKDTVSFYYSFDGRTWTQLGSKMKMSYELVHFMGSKFAIFNYATAKTGGYVDVDYFRVSDKITGAQAPAGDALGATMTATKEVSGIIGSNCEVKLNLDALKAQNHSSLKASIAIPEIMDVEKVEFNTAAIKGKAEYTYKKGRLILSVTGTNVSFEAADKLFATIKLKLKNYASKDEDVEIRADYIQVDGSADTYNADNCNAAIKLKYLDTKAVAKKLGYGNPIFTQAFGADPYAMEYGGRVWVYMTADAYQYDANGNLKDNKFEYIKTLRVVSSADLMNWTDHGEIKVAGPDGAATWANNSWAPAIAHKTINGKEKFFLYFADGGSGIGVLEGDSPLGPWRDPLGKKLFPTTYPVEGVPLLFDPAVLVDSKGDGYIYFGGGIPGDPNPTDDQKNNPNSARVAKLAPDMIHVEEKDGKPMIEKIDAPCMFEDSGIFEYNGKYYYSYCSNFSGPHYPGNPGFGNICYMVSDNPMGPFTYAGEIFSNPSVWFGTGGNNHHATFVFEGKSYFIYHAQTVSKEEGKDKGYRSTHIDNIEMNKDGSIKPIKGTWAGIDQLHTMNPYERIDAETIAWNAGVKVAPCKEEGKIFKEYNTALTDLQDKDWTAVAQLDFGKNGASEFKVNAASAIGGKIEIRLDSPEGTLIGTAEVPATGGEDTYKTVSCKVDNVTGVKNVFLVFRGDADKNIMNVDYYQFTEKEVSTDPPIETNKPAVNETFTGANGQTFKVTSLGNGNNCVTFTGADSKATDCVIPDTIEYKGQIFKVTAIADNAFANQTNLKSVTIGQNIVTIGAKAFYNAKNLKKVTIKGTAIKTIGKDAFKGINKKATFNMAKKTFTYKNLKYKVTKCTASTKEVSVTGTSKKKATSLNIPATVKYNGMTFKVTTIGKKAFRKMTKLKSATVGKNVKSIGANAFDGDKKLAKVKFSGTAIKSIGKYAFKGIKKNATFSVKKSKKSYYNRLLKKAKTKNYKVK